MVIIVFAEQFICGQWAAKKICCNQKQVERVMDYVRVRANTRSSSGKPNHADFLLAARSIFDVKHGSPNEPHDGDSRVYCICIDQLVIGVYEKIRKYSETIDEVPEFVELALQMSA